MPQVIDKKCTMCSLHKKARTVCMKGFGSENPKIIIFLDNPTNEEDKRHKGGYSKYFLLIRWMFDRMSIGDENYRIEFTLKCHAEEKDIKTQKDFRPKVDSCYIHTLAILQKFPDAEIVAMGKLSCYQLLGSDKHGDYEGTFWSQTKNNRDRDIWVTYSPAYTFQNPAESLRIYRVLWNVAWIAGLEPELNEKIKPFDFEM